MAIVINTNVASLNAQRNLNNTQSSLNKAMERLSSGFRINRSGDDAAGLAISERLKAQIRSTNQASRNTLDGISLVQVAEGAHEEVGGILIRLRELAVQSANGTLSDSDRANIDVEREQLTEEINRIAAVVKFNGVALLGGSGTAGSAALSVSLQVGIDASTAGNDVISVSINPLVASAFGALGTSATDLTALALTSVSGATEAITALDTAITDLNSSRASLGAAQNRLEVTSRNLAISAESLTAANSRIRDVDVAMETAELARAQILSQAGAAIVAQANQVPSLALSLIGR